MYYSLSDDNDVLAIFEVPNEAVAPYTALLVRSSGLVDVSISRLLSPEIIDAAAKLSSNYQAPGK